MGRQVDPPAVSTLDAEERTGLKPAAQDRERIVDEADASTDGATVNRVHGMTPDEYVDSIKTQVSQVRTLCDVPLGDAPVTASLTSTTMCSTTSTPFS